MFQSFNKISNRYVFIFLEHLNYTQNFKVRTSIILQYIYNQDLLVMLMHALIGLLNQFILALLVPTPFYSLL